MIESRRDAAEHADRSVAHLVVEAASSDRDRAGPAVPPASPSPNPGCCGLRRQRGGTPRPGLVRARILTAVFGLLSALPERALEKALETVRVGRSALACPSLPDRKIWSPAATRTALMRPPARPPSALGVGSTGAPGAGHCRRRALASGPDEAGADPRRLRQPGQATARRRAAGLLALPADRIPAVRGLRGADACPNDGQAEARPRVSHGLVSVWLRRRQGPGVCGQRVWYRQDRLEGALVAKFREAMTPPIVGALVRGERPARCSRARPRRASA